jgi:hypothetical protein
MFLAVSKLNEESVYRTPHTLFVPSHPGVVISEEEISKFQPIRNKYYHGDNNFYWIKTNKILFIEEDLTFLNNFTNSLDEKYQRKICLKFQPIRNKNWPQFNNQENAARTCCSDKELHYRIKLFMHV